MDHLQKLSWKDSPRFRQCRLEAGMKVGQRMAYAEGDDQELLRQLARGNQAAFQACYERYQVPIFRFAWHMSGNQTTAEEVTQEVFLRLIHKPKKFDPAKGSLAGYLFGIARNVMRRETAASFNNVALEDEQLGADPALSSEPDLLTELDRQERLELLHKSVLALPPSYREALILCDLEEMSYPAAAAILDCPSGTVASRLHRARAMLKSRVQAARCVR
jgi:RNA polymerase sigma-70 factor (ECF subfamily)